MSFRAHDRWTPSGARPFVALFVALFVACASEPGDLVRDGGGAPDGAVIEDVSLGDAEPGDAEPGDAEPGDAEETDEGVDDATTDASGAEEPDTTSLDAAPTDATSLDATSLDATSLDAAPTDATSLDAAPTDAGPTSLRPIAVEGFGAATVGGWQPGHDTFVVTSLDDDGPGTLREGLRTAVGPRVINFAIDGVITLSSSLLVPSNLSIDGRGRDVALVGRGLVLAGSDEVIVTNLVIRDVGPDSEDGVRIGDPVLGASERVVLDHVTFEATADHGDSTNVDEAISVIFGSRDITFAWLRFERWEKVMLFGNGDAPAATDALLRVTIHHTLTRDTGRRHPQARYGIFDVYASFFDDWHMYGFFALPPFRESFGVQAEDGALVVVENVGFRRDDGIWDLGSQADDATRCERGGVIEERGTQVVPGGTATLRFGVGCPASPLPWARPYTATIEPLDATLLQRLEAEAGATW